MTFAERVRLYPSGCFIYKSADRPCGYILSHPWVRNSPTPLNALLGQIPGDARTYYLHDLALLPKVRGLGAGGAGVSVGKMAAGLAVATSVWLDCIVGTSDGAADEAADGVALATGRAETTGAGVGWQATSVPTTMSTAATPKTER